MLREWGIQIRAAARRFPGFTQSGSGCFELIQYYAQAQKMDEIHVDSHSGALDHILQHQRFERQDVEKCLWIYRVNHN